MAFRGSVEGGSFSAFCFRQSQLFAVDSINRPGDQMIARRLIAKGPSPSLEQVQDESFDLKSLLKATERVGG
ncbi:MAG: oxidoreductase C-terminal domain-containing protein [Bradyrhizobium sp.]